MAMIETKTCKRKTWHELKEEIRFSSIEENAILNIENVHLMGTSQYIQVVVTLL